MWLAYFKSNVLVVRSEDYFAEPMAQMHRIFRHLGFADADLDQAARAEVQRAGQPKSSHQQQHAMLPDARALMADFYAPYNAALADLTGDVRFLEWNKN